MFVTGSRVPLRQAEIGFGSSLIQHADLNGEPSAYAARVLPHLPGLWIDEGAGPGGPTVIRLRGGEEPFTQLLFDGVPININGGFLDIQGLTLSNVERIEVTRGPQSALYGSSAMSGVVQFITRRGPVSAPRFELLAEGGRAAEHGQQARTELALLGGTPRLQYSSAVALTYNRGLFAIPHDLWSGDGSLRLDVTPASRWTVTGTLRYMDIASHLPVRDPGATRVPLDPNQRDRRDRIVAALNGTFAATPGQTHRVSASLFVDDFLYEDERDGIADTTSYPFFVFDADFSLRSKLRRAAVEYAGTIGADASDTLRGPTLAYGARWEREDIVDEQGGEFGESRLALDRWTSAVFAELNGRVGRHVFLLVGTRFEKPEGLPTQLLPRGSVVFEVVPDRLALRAAGGRAFKAPNLQQQFLENPFTEPNPDLKPESSVSWEVGASVLTLQGRLTIGLGYFSQRFDDLIRTVPADTGSKQTNRNLGRSRARGLELDLDARWSDRWRSGLNATWLRATVVDNTGLSPTDYPEGSKLPAIPQWTGNAFVESGLSSTARATLRATLVGKRVVFSERFTGARETLDPYVLLGATFHFRASSRVGFYASLDNLLDVEYATAFDRPGVPLTAVIGVRLTN